jgi:heat-inducible transcriptional repressor
MTGKRVADVAGAETGSGLTQRQRNVLVAVIRKHVSTARPVGSSALTKETSLGIGAASIRRTMAELEELGLLSHPHTSAGRVPTQVGYRTYVDWLMRPERLVSSVAQAIEEQLNEARGGMEQIVVRACHVLSGLSKQLAVATRPVLADTPVDRVEVVALGPRRLLLAVVCGRRVVRTAVVETKHTVSAQDARQAGRVLNEVACGLTPREVLAVLEGEESLSMRPPLGPVLRRVVGRLMYTMGVGTLYFEGASYVLEQPEFGDGHRLRGLFDALEERASLARELCEHTEGPRPTVLIAGEHLCRGMDCVSLVSSRYGSAGMGGVLAVVGPTRMRYSRLVPVVEGVARAVTRVLGE